MVSRGEPLEGLVKVFTFAVRIAIAWTVLSLLLTVSWMLLLEVGRRFGSRAGSKPLAWEERQRECGVSDSRARRAAKRAGLTVRKSRRHQSLDNFGGYMLVDPERNLVVAGSRFELTAQEVVDCCWRPDD